MQESISRYTKISLRKKCPYSELFWSECGKMRTRITPNTDTFHAMNFTEFGGYNLFPLILIFISSGSNFLGDLKITSSVFSTLTEILFALNQLSKCFLSRLTSLLRFFTHLLVLKRCISSAKWCTLPYGDHYKLKKEVVLSQNLVVHNNQLALNQNHTHW